MNRYADYRRYGKLYFMSLEKLIIGYLNAVSCPLRKTNNQSKLYGTCTVAKCNLCWAEKNENYTNIENPLKWWSMSANKVTYFSFCCCCSCCSGWFPWQCCSFLFFAFHFIYVTYSLLERIAEARKYLMEQISFLWYKINWLHILFLWNLPVASLLLACLLIFESTNSRTIGWANILRSVFVSIQRPISIIVWCWISNSCFYVRLIFWFIWYSCYFLLFGYYLQSSGHFVRIFINVTQLIISKYEFTMNKCQSSVVWYI